MSHILFILLIGSVGIAKKVGAEGGINPQTGLIKRGNDLTIVLENIKSLPIMKY